MPDASALCNSVLKDFINLSLRRGVSPSTVNFDIRHLNAFFNWLSAEGHTSTRFRMKEIKSTKAIRKPLTREHIKRIIEWEPDDFCGKRLHALLCLLIDTGVRIDEARTLKRSNVDFDEGMVLVRGKGSKERYVPIGKKVSTILKEFARTHKSDIFFPTSTGNQLEYHNMRRDLHLLFERLGIKEVDGSYHLFRHGFARNYVRRGGDLFTLKKAMGHCELRTTLGYVELSTDDLKRMHKKTSMLDHIYEEEVD
jgi:integrase/recombinase XerD